MNPAPVDPVLAQGLASLLPGRQLVRAWPLGGGISAQTTACELRGPDGPLQRVVLRQLGARVLAQRPDAALTEARILEALAPVGVAAPRLLACDPDGSHLGTPSLVMTHLPGRPDNNPADPDHALRQMAEELARIHQVRALPGLALPQQTDVLELHVKRSLGEMAHERLGGPLREVLQAAWPWTPDNPSTLLHGDFWPGNLLWSEGRLTAVVDWEDAAWGDPLADLAQARLDLFWRWGAEGMALFTAHYLCCHPLVTRQLPLWDAAAALRPLGRLAEWAEGWRQLGGPVLTLADFERGHADFCARIWADRGASVLE
ncbi:MAG: phosphotransferase family protein [Candidatus Sericytochromatia bacterium]